MKPYFKVLRKSILIQLFFSLMYTLTNVFLPYINLQLFDHVENLTISLIVTLVIAYLILILLNSVFQYIYQSMDWRISSKFRELLQIDLFSSVQSLDNDEFSKTTPGGYLSIFNNDVEALDSGYVSPILDIIRAVIELVCYSAALVIFVDIRVAVSVIGASLVAAVMPKLLSQKLSEKRRRQLKEYQNYFHKLEELLESKSLINPLTFRGFTRRHFRATKEAQDSLYEYGKFKSLANTANGLTMFFVSLVAFGTIATLLYQKQITLGAAVATFSYVDNFIYPIRYILTDVNLIHSVKDTREQILQWLNGSKMVEKVTDYPIMEKVVMENIEYAVNEQLHLKEIYLSIEKGQKVALIGESGSGKSTLLRILAGQLKPDSGEITYFDSQLESVESWEMMFYSDQFGVVFNETYVDNISVFSSYPNCNLSVPAAIGKLEFRFLNRKINPENLSGGEKQRILLHRALSSRRSLLVLDEPFASLDDNNVGVLTDFLVSCGKLALIVATHNTTPDYLAKFDAVYQLENGHLEKVAFHRGIEPI